MINVFDITDFGAVSDGKTNCTAAIQAALDEARKVCGTVLVPPGRFLCADLRMYRNVSIKGFDSWSYREYTGSVLELCDENARCVLNISAAPGCTVSNLSIDGKNLGKKIHGVMLDYPIYDAAGEEDTPTVENCRIGNFSGSAVYLNHVWCFTIRNNMLCFSEHGLYVDGWDAFISGNWFSGNRRCGMCGGDVFSASMFTANRIEWNREAGVSIRNCKFITMTGNQFDRAGGPQLRIYSDPEKYNRNITVTGNVFNRSGAGIYDEWMQADGYLNSHFNVENCVNLVFTSNTLHAGRDGKDENCERHFGPAYGIVCKHLRSSVIKDNVLQGASTKQNVVDLGDHEEEVIIRDNLGSVMESPERWTAMLKDYPVEVIRSYYDLPPEEQEALRKSVEP